MHTYAHTHTEKGWPNTCYGTSKIGLIALTKVLARDEVSVYVYSVLVVNWALLPLLKFWHEMRFMYVYVCVCSKVGSIALTKNLARDEVSVLVVKLASWPLLRFWRKMKFVYVRVCVACVLVIK